jgi:hypothetical protein
LPICGRILLGACGLRFVAQGHERRRRAAVSASTPTGGVTARTKPGWETFHLTELRQILERGLGAGGQRAIAGLSMGGFGAMSYAGRRPDLFRAAAAFSGVLQHVNERPPPPRSIDRNVDPRLSVWIERLLEKQPDNRPASALKAWAELEAIVDDVPGHSWRAQARLIEQVPTAEPPEPPPASLPPAFLDVDTEQLPGQPVRRPPPLGAPPAAPAPNLRTMLRAAALTGVVPVRKRHRGRATRRTHPPASVPARTPQDDTWLRPNHAPAGSRPPLLLRLALPFAALGALALAAKWLLGLFEESGEHEAAAADLVQCTVFAPPSVAAGNAILVQVFVHLPEQADDARAIATELDTEARRRAFRGLEAPVGVGSRLAFELRLPGLLIHDPVASLIWRRRTEAVQFEVAIPHGTATGTVVGTLSVDLDSMPVGHVKFKLAIAPEAGKPPPEAQGEEARRYRAAFISYSSNDRDEVLRRVQVLSIVGIKYFQDLLSLEPGDRWLKRVELGIDECDLSLLFWSSDAKQSEWVRQEVRHALARKAGDELSLPEIRPVVLEGPPIVEPWEELAHLHFNDRLLYFTTRPPALGDVCTACGQRNQRQAEFCAHCGEYLPWQKPHG